MTEGNIVAWAVKFRQHLSYWTFPSWALLPSLMCPLTPTHQHRSHHTPELMYFFFSRSPNIMHNAPHLGLHSACSTSNVIANGECTAEQRLQQRIDSPQVKACSLLFLPTSPFCHLNTLCLKETLALLLWSVCSDGYSRAHLLRWYWWNRSKRTDVCPRRSYHFICSIGIFIINFDKSSKPWNWHCDLIFIRLITTVFENSFLFRRSSITVFALCRPSANCTLVINYIMCRVLDSFHLP